MGTWYELIAHYGYISIFVILGIGIVGLPVPDEVLLTYLGYLTSSGQMHFSLAYISALLGALCGITLSYFLGLKLGEPFLRKFGSKLFIKEKSILKTKRLFSQYGPFVLFLCYFIPGVRHIAAYVAGITEYSYRRFASIAYLGATAWVTVFLVLGNRLGSKWELISTHLHQYALFMLILAVLVTVGTIVYKNVTNKQRKNSC